MPDSLSPVSQIYQFASTSTFLSGLSIGAIVGFLIKQIVDWYLTKFKTRRSEKEKRRLSGYEQMLELVEDFDGKNRLLQFRWSHRDQEEEDRIVQQAIKEGKDPKHTLTNSIIPENKPEILMIEMRKRLARVGDSKAESLASDWAKALDYCMSAQIAFGKVKDQKLLPEKWTELLESMESAWEREIETKKALLKYLRGCLR